MTKIIVFDTVNLTTALLARQIQDFNDDIWVFMNGQIEADNTPVVFKESEYIAWLLNFCDAEVTVVRDDISDDFVYVPNNTTSDLIDRLLNKSNISLTSDTPISINFKNKTVTLNDTVGYSYIPFGDITSIFIAQPIDKFYGFKFGKLIYRKPTHIFASSPIDTASSLEFIAVDYVKNTITNSYINDIKWYYDDKVLNHNIRYDLITDSAAVDDTCYVDSFLSNDNLNLFNSYLTYNKLNKQLRYIGPSLFNWPINPLVVDLDNLFEIIK